MINKLSSHPSLFCSLSDQLNQKHPLYILAGKIDWYRFEEAFTPLYCVNNGRPAKPIRLMCGLLSLKHVRNLSDESVVGQWSENAYYQYFCGMSEFTPSYPCNASELVHFRKRIGEKGMELILAESIRVNQEDDDRDHHGTAFIDSTVQEKNITYPTDAKLHKKIVRNVLSVVKSSGLPLRQNYTFVLKKIYRDQRFRNHPRNRSKTLKADRRLRTIAGRLVRELRRNLKESHGYDSQLDLFERVLSQKRHFPGKIYSLHEPQVQCISEGKRKYSKKSNTVRLCADDLLNRQKLIGYHDSYATVMAEYGLERGVRGSEARHTTTTQYYREVQKMNNTLDMETKRLQEQKAEAEEELKQVKSEIRTDKLKSVATDTATALASSVGSLFGSGKMKSLERKNEDLQDRILKLEEHSRQREQHIKAMEQQQAKQIQEIKDAYEQRHRKMSDFVNFVKCYFPYVEKLMPMIIFLRDRLKFKDSTIRKVYEFKNVTVSGSFYSSEFNQNFEAKHSVCSIKQEENGGYDFKIDGVFHVNWFRKKRDEWREAMGIPKPRQTQNRGMKL